MGEENLQNCAFPLGLHHPAGGGPSHGRRQHAQKFGKDRAWVLEICSQMRLLQYFATATAGKVNI